jgi:hypothetical protein
VEVRTTTPSARTTPPVDSEGELRWAAWISRGHQQDALARHRMRLALVAGIILVVLGGVVYGLFGGAL